jgi:hypothetical protein
MNNDDSNTIDLSSIDPVKFSWNESDMTTGFIAQEVEDIVPDLVRQDADGYLALRDRGIPALLLEAIKELKTELDEARAEIKELKKKISFE